MLNDVILESKKKCKFINESFIFTLQITFYNKATNKKFIFIVIYAVTQIKAGKLFEFFSSLRKTKKKF